MLYIYVKKNKMLKKFTHLVKRIYYGVINYIHYIPSLIYMKINERRVKSKVANGDVVNVIFLIQYIPGWNKLEPIYVQMKKHPRFNPIIVCVPLDVVNKNNNEIYDYFKQNGYNCINAIQKNGQWFDIKSLNPDYVFHSRPYNAFMPNIYKSKNIRKYSLVCNVLYGASLTENAQIVTLNKDYYRDVYSYFCFDEDEKRFYKKRFSLGFKTRIQKCFQYGAIGLEQMIKCRKNQEKTNFKKIVLWTPRWSTDPFVGGSNFFRYINSILNLIEKNKDILFVIRPHPLMFNNFIKTKEMSLEDVQQFHKFCNEKDNVILDESKEYSKLFWNSDFLITDASGIVPEYFMTEKPIMYCNSNIDFRYLPYAKKMIEECYEVNNEIDLEKYFELLKLGIDEKSNNRKAYINEYFSDVSNNSTHILETLLENI